MKSVRKKLGRRFLPLYAASFFQGFVLWYAIEKLFMRSIGFDNASIGITVAVTSACVLVLETPSGILADRWSRKGVLVLANLALMVSSIIGGLSYSIPIYLVASVFWGAYFALYSGVYDAITYDTLLEETGKADLFERYYGKVQFAAGLALAGGGLLGGIVGELIGLRAAYFFTVLSSIMAAGALFLFREPRLHKAHGPISVKEQIVTTMQEVLRKRSLLPILSVLIVLAVLRSVLFEFQQLWLIALAAPVFVFGPANALVFSTIGMGGITASYMKMHRFRVMLLTLVVLLGSALGLVFLRSIPGIVTAQVLFGVCLLGMSIVFSRFLHDSLPSRVRSGSSSVVSTISRLLIIPLSIFFGLVSERTSVFTASWLIIVLAVLVSGLVLKAFSVRSRLTPVTLEDEIFIEHHEK